MLLPAHAALHALLTWAQRHRPQGSWELKVAGLARIAEGHLVYRRQLFLADGGSPAGWEEECARAVALRRCGNVECANLEGATEAGLPRKRCSGCRVLHFCSDACLRAAWGAGHRAVCRRLSAQAAAVAGR